MMTQHHPAEETLLAHAGGSLPHALGVVVGMHVDTCMACRAEIALWEKVGGAFLEELPPAQMSSTALANLSARIDAPVIAAETPYKPRERWVGPGIWFTPLLHDEEQGTHLYRLRVRAGTKLPSHGHNGRELTYVLAGEIEDGERHYEPGDVLEADAAHQHEPRVSGTSECVCIIGSEGPPRIPGLGGLLLRAIF